MKANFAAFVLFASAFAAAGAQRAPAFIGSSGNFLTSSFCTGVAKCAKTGTVDLGRDRARGPMTEEYYLVTPAVRQPLGQEAYTVVVTRFGGKVSRVALRYQPHQDIPENGDVARAVVGFASGVPLDKGWELYGAQCDTYVKNGNRFFIVQPPVRMNLSGVSEAIISVSDTPPVSMDGEFKGSAPVQFHYVPGCPAPKKTTP